MNGGRIMWSKNAHMLIALSATVAIGLSSVLSEPIRPEGASKSKVFQYTDLGEHTRSVATLNPEAQKYFDQGLAFMYAYNHDEAIRAFQHAAELDPHCAMAHWGASLSMGKNYNYPFFPPEKAKAAWKSLELAQATSKNEPEANRAMIEALAARYADPLPKETRPLEEAYAKAMKAASEKFPKDADIGALYAESMMNLRPWDLWTIDGRPQPETAEFLPALEPVLAF